MSRKSVPSTGTLNPNVTVNFENDRTLFINIFYTVNASNIHLFYDFELK